MNSQLNKDLSQDVLHFRSKFGDSRLNANNLGLYAHARTHTQTDVGNDNARMWKMTSGKIALYRRYIFPEFYI